MTDYSNLKRLFRQSMENLDNRSLLEMYSKQIVHANETAKFLDPNSDLSGFMIAWTNNESLCDMIKERIDKIIIVREFTYNRMFVFKKFILCDDVSEFLEPNFLLEVMETSQLNVDKYPRIMEDAYSCQEIEKPGV